MKLDARKIEERIKELREDGPRATGSEEMHFIRGTITGLELALSLSKHEEPKTEEAVEKVAEMFKLTRHTLGVLSWSVLHLSEGRYKEAREHFVQLDENLRTWDSLMEVER